MRRRGGPISITVLLGLTIWLMGNSSFFNALIDDFEAWKDGQTPGEIPDSFPDLGELAGEITEFTIPDGIETPPGLTPTTVPTTGEGDGNGNSSTIAPSEGTQAVTLSQVDPSAPGLLPISNKDKAQAVALIEQVRTAGRGPKTGYDRDMFGSSWTDDNPDSLFGHNGCDTRNDILERDINGETFRPNTDNCVVLSGTMSPEPYTGKPLHWSREGGGIDIDHVVALSAAWQMGAAHWDDETRTAFANDPLNLIAAQSSANRQKGDSTPASWLPPSKAIRCAYVTRYAAVSLRYDLAVTEADKEMMVRQCS